MKIFNKHLFMGTEGEEEYEGNKDWLDLVHGKKVETFYENGDGMIGNYFIASEWMEEVEELC